MRARRDVPRVSDADQEAFTAEAAELRKTLNALKRERWKRQKSHRWPVSLEKIAAMDQRLQPIRQRLDHWRGIVMADEIRIRAPVRLYDAWRKLQDRADIEQRELKEARE